MTWREITRDADNFPVQAAAPGKIQDALQTFLHQVGQALREDGMDFGVLEEQLATLDVSMTDLVRGFNDRVVAEWETVVDEIAQLDRMFPTPAVFSLLPPADESGSEGRA